MQYLMMLWKTMKISNKFSDDLLSTMILIATLVLTKGTTRKTRFSPCSKKINSWRLPR